MKRFLIILAVVITVALPFILRPRQHVSGPVDETVVIITPHNEAIRHEYARGFESWYRTRTGRTVRIDWRVIGGTSEIARFLEGEYVASFRNYWTKLKHPWSTEIQAGFQDYRLPTTAPSAVKEARAAFLASNVGCGIDLFFGGGTYDFSRQAQVGRLVASELRVKHPEWFADQVIPRIQAGEEYWDEQGRWIGAVLSSYGIVFNRDSLRRLGFTHEPEHWADLTDPRLVGEVALCDPTKSGSIAKAFENIIQQQMQRRLTALRASEPNAEARLIEARAVQEGWLAGLQLLQLIGANSRYFTDSSQKPPIDVAAGNCAVGLCIDFYGRQQNEAVRRRNGSDRVGYVTPIGGSVSSVDPIGLLRGARNRVVAESFIEYTLSLEGQKLWNFKVGTAGGPERFVLRRLPVRRDFYARDDWKPLRSDPEENPYEQKEQLVYRSAWTGDIFREMSFIIRVMCADTHGELVEAWRAIIAAPEPAKTKALAVLQDLSTVDYEQARGTVRQCLGAKNKVEEVLLAKRLATGFREQYARAAEIARGR